jgi:hypothetical protein
VQLAIDIGSATEQENECFSNLNTIFLPIGNVTVPRSNHWMFSISGVHHDDGFTRRSLIVDSFLANVHNPVTSGFLMIANGVAVIMLHRIVHS